MNNIIVRLDAITPLGNIYFVEKTSTLLDGSGIRSILARVSGPCIADEHGDALAIATVIRDALEAAGI